MLYNLIINKGDVFTMGKRYDNEYKEYVAKLVVEEGRVASQVAYELEIPVSSLARWVQNYKKKIHAAKNPTTYITPTELEKLRKEHQKEIDRLKEENEILKKAMHIFTQNQE
jgi:transposase